MADDTQNPNTEPGCDDVLPPLHVSRSYVDVNEPLTLPGQRLADDGFSHVMSSRPNNEPPIGGEYRIRYERISGICEQLRADPWKLERIENLLGILATDPSVRERLGAIAVKLASSPGLIENAEQLIAMGS